MRSEVEIASEGMKVLIERLGMVEAKNSSPLFTENLLIKQNGGKNSGPIKL